jgi:hypothetical protein
MPTGTYTTQEIRRAARAFERLADRLHKDGFPVLAGKAAAYSGQCLVSRGPRNHHKFVDPDLEKAIETRIRMGMDEGLRTASSAPAKRITMRDLYRPAYKSQSQLTPDSREPLAQKYEIIAEAFDGLAVHNPARSDEWRSIAAIARGAAYKVRKPLLTPYATDVDFEWSQLEAALGQAKFPRMPATLLDLVETARKMIAKFEAARVS